MPFKIKETILGFSIAIIFVFFVVFGIKAFYKEPKYEDFCSRGASIDVVYSEGNYGVAYPYPIRFKESGENVCAKSLSFKIGAPFFFILKRVDVLFEYDENGCKIAKECTFCQQNYNKARNIYFRNVFIISGIVGIIVIIIGAILNLTSISAVLFGGGVLKIIYGTTNYWSELADWARFIILGIALAVLIYLGYKCFSVLGFGGKKNKEKKKR